MRTLAKLWEIFCGIQGTRFQPNELTEDRYSISIVNCPMLNVGKGIGFDVKSKFCDAVCAGASGGLMDVHTLLPTEKY